jgi:orotidine-5'-phosphate decarboxylase
MKPEWKFPPVAVALDGMTPERALDTAAKLVDSRAVLKMNDLLDDPDAGPGFIKRLKGPSFGFAVWADPKFKDIPKTMGNRTAKLVSAGANIITIHASNTIEAMKAAVNNRGDAVILAVTVLTSMQEDDCQDIYGGPIKTKVLRFARNALLAGVQGIVCSPAELEFLAKYPELDPLFKVTPNIRPMWYQETDDQNAKRSMMPADAIKLGASCLVMGRPILESSLLPADALKKTLGEIESARAEMVAAK